jgi:5-methylcytosine-specific restriction protein A
LTTSTQRKRGSAGVKDRNRIRERDCGMCQHCKAQGIARLGTQVDHVIALWAGGSDADDNKQLLCDPCHDAKTKREAAERAAGG